MGSEEHEAFTLADAVKKVLDTDVQPSGPLEEQVLIPFSNVNAVIETSGDEARKAILELERAGIEGGRISFLQLEAAHDPRQSPGQHGETAEEGAPGTVSRGIADVASNVVGGAVIGVLVGAVVIGAIVWAVQNLQAALWAAVGAAVFFGALGALWSGFSKLGASTAWERTLHTPVQATAFVGIHVDDDEGLEDLESIIAERRVWLFDRQGNVVRQPP